MNEQKFHSEMRRAKTMQEAEEFPRNEYWVGYQRGLRRLHHGENFGTAEEHARWLSCINDPDEQHKQRGLGYRDALALGEISSRIGAPSKVGPDWVTLNPLRISRQLKKELEARAKAQGIDLPDLQRIALSLYVGGVSVAIDYDLAARRGGL